MAILFGSLLRAASVTEAMPGAPGGAAMAAGPTWEGWIEPPDYTGRPSLYLADQPEGEVEVPVGSILTLRLYGAPGSLTVEETVFRPHGTRFRHGACAELRDHPLGPARGGGRRGRGVDARHDPRRPA